HIPSSKEMVFKIGNLELFDSQNIYGSQFVLHIAMGCSCVNRRLRSLFGWDFLRCRKGRNLNRNRLAMEGVIALIFWIKKGKFNWRNLFYRLRKQTQFGDKLFCSGPFGLFFGR